MSKSEQLPRMPIVPPKILGDKKAYCQACFGRGIRKTFLSPREESPIGPQERFEDKVRRANMPYVRCHCGRMPNSHGQALLAKQERLENRLRDLKEGKSW